MHLLAALLYSEKPRQGHVASSWHVHSWVKPHSFSLLDVVCHHLHQRSSIVVSSELLSAWHAGLSDASCAPLRPS